MSLFPSDVFTLPTTPAPIRVTEANQDRHAEAGAEILAEALSDTGSTRLFKAGGLEESRTVRVMERLIIAGRDLLGGLTSGFIAGRRSLSGWFKAMARAIIPRHFAATMLVAGRLELPPADLTSLRDAINRQLVFLEGYRDVIRRGTSPTVGRSQQYANAIHVVAHNVGRLRAIRDGFTQEMRVLGARERHCEVCPQLARLKWQPIGTMPAIGETPCRIFCGCRYAYR